MEKKNSQLTIQMALVLLLWGSFAAVSKLSLGSIDGYQMLFYMFGASFLIRTGLFLANGKMKEVLRLPEKQIFKISAIGSLSFLYYALYILALEMITAIEASMLNYLFPIMIVVFSVPINKEKLTVPKVLSILLGFAGMVIIVTGGDLSSFQMTNLPGDLLAVLGAVSWGLFTNLGKKNTADNEVSNYIYTAASFLLSIVTLFLFSGFAVPDLLGVLGSAYLGLSNIVIAFYLWFRILEQAPVSLAAAVAFLAPFVTLVFIMILLKEAITLPQLLGLMVIVVGVLCQSLKFKKVPQI